MRVNNYTLFSRSTGNFTSVFLKSYRNVQSARLLFRKLLSRSPALMSVSDNRRFSHRFQSHNTLTALRLKIERLAHTMKMFFAGPFSVARFVCETNFVFPLYIYASLRFSLGEKMLRNEYAVLISVAIFANDTMHTGLNTVFWAKTPEKYFTTRNILLQMTTANVQCRYTNRKVGK